MTTRHSLVDDDAFRSSLDGREVALYNLRSGDLVAQITNYGGRIVSLFAPDRNGRPANVTLGFNSLEEYLGSRERYYGAIIGRCANRIANGRFELDGRTIHLPTNDGLNHLHGGPKGFHEVVWDVDQADERTLVLSHDSPDGDQGYPGGLKGAVRYTLSGDAIDIRYMAESDAPTIVNLTNHAYFNLAGAGAGQISGHRFLINAERFTPVDESLIPTGELAPVDGTPLDLRRPNEIADRLDSEFDQIRLGRGFDHNYVIVDDEPRTGPGGLRFAARVAEPDSGRIMEVFTTEPGIQFYSGNFFDGSDVGSSGRPHGYREAFALETQHFPDSPNKPGFPSIILRPGERYSSATRYRFTVL